MRPPLPLRALAALAAALLLVSACGDDGGDNGGDDGGSSGGSSVSQEEVEEQVATQLEAEVGQAPDDISCPGDLPAEEGETMECTLTAGSDELGVTLTVTEVDDGDVKFDIEVDDELQ